MLYLAANFLLIFALTVALTALVLVYLRKREILDHPNHRSSHSAPTPRGGGIAVAAVIIGWWIWNQGLSSAWQSYLPIAMAGLLAGLSWLDDIYRLSARTRFSIQLLAVAGSLPWIQLHGLVFQGFLPSWLDGVLVLLGWTAFINFFNFMDGIDGITGVEAGAIGTGLTIVGLAPLLAAGELASEVSVPAGLIIAAAAMGFLIWNWQPAKIFLGDVGSITLGYLLGGLLLILAASGNWAAALILPAYYLMDAGLTLSKRILRRERFWEAHRDHYYQRAVSHGLSHARVSLMIAIVNTGLICLAYWSLFQPLPSLISAFLLVALLLAWMNRSHAAAKRRHP